MNDSDLVLYLCHQQYTYLDDNQTNADYPDYDLYTHIGEILSSRVLVTICALGLLGNICNLFVLIPMGIQSPMARLEKCAYSGLVALAVSDLCFCLFVIPNCCVGKRPFDYYLSFNLIYKAFNNGLINIFVLTSTWLTVTMAIGRYLAICRPLWAREVIGPTMAKRTIIVVGVICLLLNLPRFCINQIRVITCDDQTKIYLLDSGQLQKNPTLEVIYNWFYFVIGIAIPFVILVSSNVCLIHALRTSQGGGRLIRSSDRCDPNRVITLTMVIIIVMYIALVSPAETIHFLVGYLASETGDQYNFVVKVVNTLQAVNFSFNVILYFAINVSFRRCMFKLFCCCSHHPSQHRNLSRQSTAISFKTNSGRVTANGNSYTAVTCGGHIMELSSHC